MSNQVDVKPYLEVEFKDANTNFDSIVNHYHTLNWSKHIICPCRKDVTTAAMSDCKNCLGLGRVWFGAVEIKGVLTAMNVRKNFVQWVPELQGTAMLSTDSVNQLGYYDKLIVEDGSSIHSEMVHTKIESINGVNKRVANLIYKQTKLIKVYGFISNLVNLVDITDKILPHPTDGFKVYLTDSVDSSIEKISLIYNYFTTYLIIDTLNDWRSFRQTKLLGNNQIGSTLEETINRYPFRYLLKRLHIIKSEGNL